MFWRLFRDPQMAFWSAAVIVLAALCAVAALWGGDAREQGEHLATPAVRTVTQSAADDYVAALASLMQAGLAAGTDPSALSAWAQQVDQVASAGADVRTSEGAGSHDALLTGFAAVRAQVATLLSVADDPVAATAARIQIGLQSTRLSSLVAGIPVADLPAGSLDPLGASSAAPTVPVAGTPTTPAVPTIP